MLFKLREASLKKCFLTGIILSYWPGVNYIHGYMTRGADLRLSIYSSRSKRGHQKFIIYARKLNWLFLQRRYKKIELWSVQKTNWKKKFEKSCDWFTWPCRCPFRAANASRGSYNSFLSENICQLSFSICIRVCTSNLKWRIWELLYRICANIFLNLFYPANRSLLVCACIFFCVCFSYILLFRESFANQSC